MPEFSREADRVEHSRHTERWSASSAATIR
jgi:hypothetical protein